MKFFHQEIIDKWSSYSLLEQMANIGVEVNRAINWKKKNNLKMSINAFYRAIELIDLTANDKKNKNSLKEILRLKELLGNYFLGDNIYKSIDEWWEKYFYPFNLAIRKDK